MYTASDKYKAHTDSSIVRRPKSKIVVGGVTYTGETALVSYPKINHSAERMIGVFPAKTCEFELLNREGNISLNGKEVTVYRGLEFDGETEWIPMGIFSASDDNITNELTKRTIRFKGTDRSALFDTQFVNDITYPCTVLAFVHHICERHGVILETTDFPFATRTLLSAPNADSSISERELIARITELGGCIAQISRSGGLRISSPTHTGKIVKKRYYKTVSKEPKFGAMEAVTLGHQTYTDDIIYPENKTESAVNLRIEDNPFVDGVIAEADGTTPTTRQSLIADVAQNIIGMSIVPFGVTDFVDDFVFDLGDKVTVEEKNGSTFESVILNISTSSRIKSAIGASTQKQGSTNYALAGSTKQMLQKVVLEVDHQNKKITAIVQDFSDLEKQTESSLSVMSGQIQGVVTDVGSLRSSVTQLANSVEYRFENLADPDHLTVEGVTNISAEGVKIYNGQIQIFNSDNEKIFGTDSKGALDVTGNIKVKFQNKDGTDTATLKITNEDYQSTDYATASIKVTDSSGNIFSDISMWQADGVSTTSIKSDNIELSNASGNISVNIVDNSGVSIVGITSIFGSLSVSGDTNINSELKIKNKLFVDVPTGTTKTRFSIGGGGTETFFWTDDTVFANSGITTNYNANDIFAGLTHHRTVNGTEYKYKFGIGIVEGTPTGAIELQSNGYINARLDIKEGVLAEDAVSIRGQNSYDGGVYSAWLTLGKTDLTWNGATVMVSSDAEKKVNITSAESVLNKLRDAGIYSYNYKSDKQSGEAEDGFVLNSIEPEDKETARIQYGLVIGDGYNTPSEVVSSDGKHIDLYSMIALAWKAIQELADRIDTEVINNA